VKKFEAMFRRLDSIPACDGRTDRQIFCHGIVRAMHTRRAVYNNNTEVGLHSAVSVASFNNYCILPIVQNIYNSRKSK